VAPQKKVGGTLLFFMSDVPPQADQMSDVPPQADQMSNVRCSASGGSNGKW